MNFTLATLEDEFDKKDLINKYKSGAMQIKTDDIYDPLITKKVDYKDLIIPAGIGGAVGYYIGGVGGLIVGGLIGGTVMYMINKDKKSMPILIDNKKVGNEIKEVTTSIINKVAQ